MADWGLTIFSGPFKILLTVYTAQAEKKDNI